MESTLESQRGQGGGIRDLLSDPHRIRGDLKTLGRAVREDWPVPEDVRPAIIERLVGIVAKRENEVVYKDGVATVDGPADRNAIAAAALLRQMTGDRMTDEHHLERIKHGDTSNPGGITINGPAQIVYRGVDPEAV